MKKFFLTFLAFGFSLSIFASSLEEETFFQDLKIVNILSLTEEEWMKFMQEKSPKRAIEFSHQTFLPLHLFLKGDWINLAEKESEHGTQLEIKQTFYIRYVQNEWMFSSNLTQWKSLLDFITGKASASLEIREGQPLLSLGTEAYLRAE